MTGAVCAATPDNFRIRTTDDLVTVCSVPESSPNYGLAVAFCHGYAVGAYQYYDAASGADPGARYVCLPSPPPSRSATIADFVAWARASPGSVPQTPIDAVFHFLTERYPCTR